MTNKVLKRLSHALAEHYSSRITAKKPQERLRQFINLLTAEGGVIEAIDNDHGRLVLHKRSCPFFNMADQRRSVCHLDKEILHAVVGRSVRQTACRQDGAPCCTFEIDED